MSIYATIPNMNEHKKDYYSINEFAEKIGKHPSSIRRAIKFNRISAIRIGKGKRASYRIPSIEIERIAVVDLEDMIEKLVEDRVKEILDAQRLS